MEASHRGGQAHGEEKPKWRSLDLEPHQTLPSLQRPPPDRTDGDGEPGRALMRSIVADAPPEERLDVFVTATIEPHDESIRMITVLDEAIAHAHRDARARDEIRKAFVGL